MTYLPVKQWYLKPFGFIAKCQSKDIVDQYNAGSRYFDLRIRFNKHGDLEFGHGLISYKGSVEATIDTISHFEQPVFVRILLELSKPNEEQEEHFKYFCEDIQNKYRNITFLGGERKYDWNNVYNFNATSPSLDEDYASSPDINSIWRVFPKLYKRTKHTTTKDILLIDFI